MESTGLFWNFHCLCPSQLAVLHSSRILTLTFCHVYVCHLRFETRFLRAGSSPGESKRQAFQKSICRMLVETDLNLIAWLDFKFTAQITWIYPILIYRSCHTCGSFCHLIANIYLIEITDVQQLIDCFSLLMLHREMWVYDQDFCGGCFSGRCLRWLVLIILLSYKICVVNCKYIINGQWSIFRLMVLGTVQIKLWGNIMIKKLT